MGSGGSNQGPCSEASQPASESLALSRGSQPKSINDSEQVEVDDEKELIEIEDDEEEDGADPGSKRKLTSAVWKEFKRVKYMGTIKAKCMHCSKKLSGATKNGTSHLRDHLKTCTLKRIKMGNKVLVQPHLRFGSIEAGKMAVENYTFDPDTAKDELANMIILHEYPLSMVDHVGFRRFVGALQPQFKMGTRNTVRYMVVKCYAFPSFFVLSIDLSVRYTSISIILF